MWTAIGIMAAAAIAIGAIAQTMKNRVGAAWAALTFTLECAGFVFVWIVLDMAGGTIGDTPAGLWIQTDLGMKVIGIMAALGGGLLMLLVVATVPAKEKPAGTQARRPCPHCAEAILPAATVCPHCKRDLPEAWAA